MFANRLNRALLLTSLILVGFSSLALVSNLQYRAVVVGSDRDIDDTFNDLSDEGWYPRFILKFEGEEGIWVENTRWRMLFSRQMSD